MKRLLLSLFIIISGIQVAMSQTTLEGIVIDPTTNEPVIGATVAIYKDEGLISGEITDWEGHYLFPNLEPGTFDVKTSYIGYTPAQVDGVLISAGKANQLNFELSEGLLIDEVVIVDYKVPLIELDQGSNATTVTAESIKALPVRDVTRIAATAAGVSTQEGSNDVSIRGARSGATEYYLDGVKMRGALPPTQEIEQMQVITGGIEAKYGDVIGGIISLTSKGPSNKFRGGIDMETSEFVGIDGSNLITANISGPILKKKNEDGVEKSIIGFRLAAQYKNVAESRPSYIGYRRAKEETIQKLEDNPVTTLNGSPIPSAQFMHNEDIDVLDIRPNTEDKDLSLSGKLDFRLSDNIYASISGGYTDASNRYSPFGAWTLYNWTNNPYRYDKDLRANFSFTHKLGKQDANEDDTGAFKNFYYTLQVGYEKSNSNSEDFRHKDNLFNYGFYGNKDNSFRPIPSTVTDPAKYDSTIVQRDNFGQLSIHQGYNEVIADGWSGGTEINPVLSKYYEENGFEITNLRDVWTGIYSNVGQVYDRLWKNERNTGSLNLAFGFDVDKGSSNRHSIQLGFNYEQRLNRYWSINPRDLWQVVASQANFHIKGINTEDSLGTFTIDVNDPLYGAQYGGHTYTQYGNNVEVDPTLKFYKEVRNLTGDKINEYVITGKLNPKDLRLDMFSALELNNADLIDYYGYDYTGKKLGTDVKFADFFKDKEDGRRTQKVAPLNPVYMAGYIQDKFKYKDLIVRMGVRLDYFDANTKVLKDPYSLYEIESAEEFYNRNTDKVKPESVGDDYKVYVADGASENVVGYRKEDVWYLPSGVIVDNPRDILGSIVYPAYKGREEHDDLTYFNIQREEYDINGSFEDYKPQINIMPRLSLSFPISDDAAFFAHYDVLVQRPTSGTSMTALDYFYFEDLSRLNDRSPANNANLKPEKTIDYEIGFKKKLTETSALNLSAYYRESRNLIQRRFYDNIPAPLNKYETYGNIDFGTVKGFTMSYDKRRTNNLEFKLTYTLQFAKGTGSDLNSSDGLNTNGPIRNLLPLSIDERHAINLVGDYRYMGKNMGPKVMGKNILKNSGINMVLRTVSGRPYTRRETPIERDGSGYLGSLSGSRLPWSFSIDMKVNKEFEVSTSESGKNKLYFDVYARVQNLLNTGNVIGVYGATGDPDDDGYLASEFGKDKIDNARSIDVQSYLDTYSWRLAAPSNYTLPRRIYVGMSVSF